MGYEPDFGRVPAPSMPPQWAIKRAREMTGYFAPTDMINAFARYIAKHEQPPVDPDVLAVREILAAHHSPLKHTSEEYRTGFYDKHEQFQAALAAYRKRKEAGE